MGEMNSKKQETSKTKKRKRTSVTEKLKKEIEKLKTENAEIKDQLLRKAAEFENYKKRTEKEKRELILNANEELIKNILPVIDDLERSLKSKNNNDDSFYKGIELIYSKLMKILSEQGLKKIEAIGTKFDIEKHDAIMQMESKDYDSDYVIDEYEKGYELNGKVIRHSKVVVSK